MSDPVLGLLLAGGLVAAAVLLFWPVRGLFWRWLRLVRVTERVRIEDALKHLHDCEYRGASCSLQSLSGALGLSGNRAAALLQRLEQLELVIRAGTDYELSAAGRSYALRVVRSHRLWERFLSEETGLAAAEWHAEAEHREHRTSPEQADALAARMGQPRFDPHGDPIPTRSGEIASARGVPLTALAAGSLAEIVHVEDEPQAVYAQLVAEGLHPSMRVRLVEVSHDRVRFESEADEHVLAPVVAANVSVVALAEGEQEACEPRERLSALRPGETATVRGIAPVCRGPERRRMLDLGIVPGTEVQAEMRSPAGDPTAYRIRGALIALRREQADVIQIQRAVAGAPS
jgi:DtxR family Mn-dependent transcriptional regulator